MITNNWIAFLVLVTLILSFLTEILGDTKPIKLTKGLLSILIGVVIFMVTCSKNKQDEKASNETTGKINGLKDSVNKVSNQNKAISTKIDTLNIYIQKVDSIGIKRDSLNNTPIVTKKIVNYINRIQTLNQ